MVISMDTAADQSIGSNFDAGSVVGSEDSVMSGVRNQESADEELNEDEQSKASIQTIVVKQQQQHQFITEPKQSSTLTHQLHHQANKMVVSRESSLDEEQKLMMNVEEDQEGDEEEEEERDESSVIAGTVKRPSLSDEQQQQQQLINPEHDTRIITSSNARSQQNIRKTSAENASSLLKQDFRNDCVKEDPLVARMREIVQGGSSSNQQLEQQQAKSSSGDSLDNQLENNSKASNDCHNQPQNQSQQQKRSRQIRSSHCSRHHHHHHHHHRPSIGTVSSHQMSSCPPHHHHHHHKHSTGQNQHVPGNASHHRHHHHHHHIQNQQLTHSHQHPTTESKIICSSNMEKGNSIEHSFGADQENAEQHQPEVDSSNLDQSQLSRETTSGTKRQQHDSNSSASSTSPSAFKTTHIEDGSTNLNQLQDATNMNSLDLIEKNNQNLTEMTREENLVKSGEELTTTNDGHKCLHHHHSIADGHHHHHHHQLRHSTNHQHSPHHHHHHFHNHHGRHHHHQNHKKRLVLDTSENQLEAAEQSVEEQEQETATSKQTNVDVGDGNIGKDDLDKLEEKREPLQELSANLRHTFCCPYHERHHSCQHHQQGLNLKHHPHHHHHHHHQLHQDQKKETDTIVADSTQQQSLSTRGHHHRHHHHHHHHHHGHNHGAAGKQRHARVKQKNSSSTNLNDQQEISPTDHHPIRPDDEKVDKLAPPKNQGALEAETDRQGQTRDVHAKFSNETTSISDIVHDHRHHHPQRAAPKDNEDVDSESKMNLDQDDYEAIGDGVSKVTVAKQREQLTESLIGDNDNNKIVKMDMSPNNEQSSSDTRHHGLKLANEPGHNSEISYQISGSMINKSQPYDSGSVQLRTNLVAGGQSKDNAAIKNDKVTLDQHQNQQQLVKASDASGTGASENSGSDANKQQTSYEFDRSQERDSIRGNRNKQEDRLVRQMSSSRENSQKEGVGGKRQEQQLIECSPIQSDSFQQQQQQTDQPKQTIETTMPPDRRCRLCWCCCCPCSGLSNKNNISKSEVKPIPDLPTSSNNRCQPLSNVSLEEVRLWGESFDRLMKCPDGRKIFQDFLRCEYSEENILFWIACEELKSERDSKSIATKARDIYEDYISILSAKEVSLDSRVRDVINNNIKKPTSNIFDEAQLQIYTLMHRDSYPRFINSPMYKKLAQIQNSSRKGST